MGILVNMPHPQYDRQNNYQKIDLRYIGFDERHSVNCKGDEKFTLTKPFPMLGKITYKNYIVLERSYIRQL